MYILAYIKRQLAEASSEKISNMIIDFSELLKNWANPQDQQIKDKAFIYSMIDQPPTILKNGLTKYFNDLMENKHPRGM
jgi:hypothetical protein